MPHSPPESELESDEQRVNRIAELAQARGLRVAVAESLTAGSISAVLGTGESASEWYRGAVVAYHPEVKFEVLGVTPGPVVTASCAREMAVGVRKALGADVGLGVTGVGGPTPEEDCPPGTVHLALAVDGATRSLHVRLPGDPGEVVAATTSLALDELVRELSRPPEDPTAG